MFGSPDRSPIPFDELGIKTPEGSLAELDRFALNNYLASLFLARETLVGCWGDDSEDLASFDTVLSAAVLVAVDRRGLSTLMGEAQLLGWVENGVDILPLIQSSLRAFYESIKPENQEKLTNIPIIGVVGKIASGKGTVASILSKQYDVASFPFSDRLRAIALAMGFRPPYSREQLRTINDIYKPTFGKQIFVEWTMILAARRAKSLHIPQLIVVDGFRSEQEAQFFLSQPNTHLVAIIASEDKEEDRLIRFERQKERRRGHEDSLTMEAFMKDDAIEGEWIDPVIDLVQEKGKIIINDGDLTVLSTKVVSSLEGILP